MVRQHGVAPERVLDPENGVDERIVLLGRAELGPDLHQTLPRAQLRLCDVSVVVPDRLPIPGGQIGKGRHRNQPESEKPHPTRSVFSVERLKLRHSACARFRAQIASLQHPNSLVDVRQTNRQRQPFAFAAFDR